MPNPNGQPIVMSSTHWQLNKYKKATMAFGSGILPCVCMHEATSLMDVPYAALCSSREVLIIPPINAKSFGSRGPRALLPLRQEHPSHDSDVSQRRFTSGLKHERHSKIIACF